MNSNAGSNHRGGGRPTLGLNPSLSPGIARGHRLRLAPHSLQRVESTDFRPEQVHNDIARVEQHPVAILFAFQGNPFQSGALHLFAQMFRHGSDLPPRCSRRNDHVIGQRGLARKLDGNDVFGFIVLQRRGDDRQ